MAIIFDQLNEEQFNEWANKYMQYSQKPSTVPMPSMMDRIFKLEDDKKSLFDYMSKLNAEPATNFKWFNDDPVTTELGILNQYGFRPELGPTPSESP